MVSEGKSTLPLHPLHLLHTLSLDLFLCLFICPLGLLLLLYHLLSFRIICLEGVIHIGFYPICFSTFLFQLLNALLSIILFILLRSTILLDPLFYINPRASVASYIHTFIRNSFFIPFLKTLQ